MRMGARSSLIVLAAAATVLCGWSQESPAGARFKWHQTTVLMATLHSVIVHHVAGKRYYDVIDDTLFVGGLPSRDTAFCTSDEIRSLGFTRGTCAVSRTIWEDSDCDDDNDCGQLTISEAVLSDPEIVSAMNNYGKNPCGILTNPENVREFNTYPKPKVYLSSRDTAPRGMPVGAATLWRLAGCATKEPLTITSFNWDRSTKTLVAHFARRR